MLRPKKMTKVRIIVLKSVVQELIKDLHMTGVVDIRHSKYEGLEQGRPLASFDEISAQLLKLRSLISLMQSNIGDVNIEPKMLTGEEALVRAKRLDVGDKLRALGREASELSDELTALEAKAAVIERLLHFSGFDFSTLGSKTVRYRAGEIPASRYPRLARELEAAEGESSVVRDPNSDTTILFYERSRDDDVDAILSELGFEDLDIPEDMTKPPESIDRVRADYDSKKDRLERVKAEMISLSEDNLEEVASLERSLEVIADRTSISNRFSSSNRLYVVEGWLTAEDFGKLEELIGRYKEQAMLQEVRYSHDEMPPTVLDNPGSASPFEFLTKSYSLPNYYEIDPTMMYLLFLPILYGMIVGDFIYGVISLGLSWWLMGKFRNSYTMYNVSKIWFYSAFPTIVFGILFDEYAGMTHFHLLEYLGGWLGVTLATAPLYTGVLHRVSEFMVLLGVTALAGMIHLGVGFGIGAINEWNHNKKHAFAKVAWIGVELSILLIILPQIGLVDAAFMTAGIAVLVVSVIGLAFTEGIIGIIELPGLVGNILSYTRIAAIGLVGIVIAEMLNEFLIPLPEQGILAFILIPLFFSLHVVNAFIAMFESLIQTGRLNIVEFRSKFLHGGGDEFSPFMLKK